jgi:hypothetical protein
MTQTTPDSYWQNLEDRLERLIRAGHGETEEAYCVRGCLLNDSFKWQEPAQHSPEMTRPDGKRGSWWMGPTTVIPLWSGWDQPGP